jgi:hypothetical protein
MIRPMKRILAIAVTAGAVLGLTGTGLPGTGLAGTALAGTGLAAPAAVARPAPLPRATLRVVPGWTYQGIGKLAVIASCSQRGDVRVVGSKLLPRPATLRKGPNLEIKITDKTRPGKDAINLFCIGKNKQIDSAATKKVRILKVLGAFQQQDAPRLPKNFKPDATVSSGPPPPAKKGQTTKPAKPGNGR